MNKGEILLGFVNGACDFLNKIDKALNNEEQKNNGKPNNDEVELLTSEKLSQLYWMNSQQLRAIYKNGKKKTKIDDNPAAYSKLKWFSSEQLRAIFGNDYDSDSEEDDD